MWTVYEPPSRESNVEVDARRRLLETLGERATISEEGESSETWLYCSSSLM